MSVWLECCMCKLSNTIHEYFSKVVVIFSLDSGALGLVIGLFGCCKRYLCD